MCCSRRRETREQSAGCARGSACSARRVHSGRLRTRRRRRCAGCDAGRDADVDHDRRHVPAQRPGVVYAPIPRRDGGRTSTGSTSARGRTARSAASTAARSSGSTTTTGTTPPTRPADEQARARRTRSSRSSARSAPSHNQAIRSTTEPAQDPADARLDRGDASSGPQYKQYPWTIGWQPDYFAEGRIYGEWISDRTRRTRRSPSSTRTTTTARTTSTGLKIGPRREGEPEHLRSRATRRHGHELRARRSCGRRHPDADTWVAVFATPTPTVQRARDGEGAQLDAEHDRHQLGLGERLPS